MIFSLTQITFLLRPRQSESLMARVSSLLSSSSEASETISDLIHEQVGLLQRGEVTATIKFVEVNELSEPSFCPAAREADSVRRETY